ncbi:hypothetical protein [Desulfosporosinus sp.]|uniref:YncE family protein n=1 Tax=Desulfosporosinus sp. TaxID=157907 RepID=UPI0025B8CAF0|nr:hypothetical protein [Desulfosporosinus sp.]MBC2724116.1 hypothetical protein [Desulfosporosinus sp.]MBC2726223.1 hypothetical protein [Desulfosporosinus sp.]
MVIFSETLLADLLILSSPFGIAITPDGSRAFVTNLTNNTVTVLDTAINAIIATLPAGGGPHGILN